MERSCWRCFLKWNRSFGCASGRRGVVCFWGLGGVCFLGGLGPSAAPQEDGGVFGFAGLGGVCFLLDLGLFCFQVKTLHFELNVFCGSIIYFF